MQLYRQTAIFCLCQAVAGRQGGGGHIATGDAGPGPPRQTCSYCWRTSRKSMLAVVAAAAVVVVSRADTFNCNISDYNSVVRLTMADTAAK